MKQIIVQHNILSTEDILTFLPHSRILSLSVNYKVARKIFEFSKKKKKFKNCVPHKYLRALLINQLYLGRYEI